MTLCTSAKHHDSDFMHDIYDEDISTFTIGIKTRFLDVVYGRVMLLPDRIEDFLCRRKPPPLRTLLYFLQRLAPLNSNVLTHASTPCWKSLAINANVVACR